MEHDVPDRGLDKSPVECVEQGSAQDSEVVLEVDLVVEFGVFQLLDECLLLPRSQDEASQFIVRVLEATLDLLLDFVLHQKQHDSCYTSLEA